MPRILRAALMLAALAAGTLLPACTKDDHPAAAPASEPGSTRSTVEVVRSTHTTRRNDGSDEIDPEHDLRAEIEAAYLQAARVMDQAFAASDPDHPGLALTRAEPSLSSTRAYLSTRRRDGLVLRYPQGIPPKQIVEDVEVRGPEQATVTVCVIDNAQLVSASSGEVQDDDIVSRLMTVEMTQTDATWKITSVDEIDQAEGAGGCHQ